MPIILYLLILIVFIGLTKAIGAAPLLPTSTAQYVVLIPIVFTLYLGSKRYGFFPQRVLAPMIFIASITGFVTYYDVPAIDRKIGLIVSNLGDDALGQESSRFRERLGSRAEHYDVAVKPHFASIKDPTTAIKIATNNHAIVVAGDLKFLKIYVPTPKNTAESIQAILRISGLKLALPALGVGLSLNPTAASEHYLIALAKGVGEQRLAGKLTALEEQSLLEAAAIPALWSSYAHRAFPLWLLATRMLDTSFRNDSIELGAIECAQRLLSRSLKYITIKDNPPLLAAIYNNLAVATALHSNLSGEKRGARIIKIYLRKAAALAKLRSPYGERTIIKLIRANKQNFRNRSKKSSGKINRKKRKDG